MFSSLDKKHSATFNVGNLPYLEGLNAYISFVYNTYMLVCDNKFSKIAADSDAAEFTSRLGFGMLIRHAVEAITSSLATEIGIDPSDKTVDERLSLLKGHIVCGYDRKIEQTLYDAKQFANSVAHPNIKGSHLSSFEELYNFYDNEFRFVIDWYIDNMRALSVVKFGSHTDINTIHFRKTVYKYLIGIKSRIEKFNIKDKVTHTLLRCCLIRQLTECTVDLWVYNQGLSLRNEASPDSLHIKLLALSQIAETNKEHSALSPAIVTLLFELKNGSNCLMHIDNFNIKYILKKRAEIVDLHPLIEWECSPDIIKAKFAAVKGAGHQRQSKPGIISLILCGLTGWFGTHHFYSGNIGKGISSLLLGVWGAFIGFVAYTDSINSRWIALFLCLGSLIAPLVSLYNMREGEFRSKKWGKYPITKFANILSLLLAALHIFLDYLFITKIIF